MGNSFEGGDFIFIVLFFWFSKVNDVLRGLEI